MREFVFRNVKGHRPTVHLVGVNHNCQYSTTLSRKQLPFSEGGSDKAPCDGAFANFLADIANRISAKVIAEELSQEALLKKGDGGVSVAQTVAIESGCIHIFCDPDTSERAALTDDLDLQKMYKITFTYRNLNTRDIFYRELFWLKKLSPFLSYDDIIFICGVNHVASFSRVLQDRGIFSKIIASDFLDERFHLYLPTRVYDPNIVGPFGICIQCYVPISPNYNFCLHCGNQHSHFVNPDDPKQYKCAKHQSQNADTFCSLCRNPICKQCYDIDRVALAGLVFPVHSCYDCLQLREEKHTEYLKTIGETHCCAKHFDRAATAKCIACERPHCDSCLYYESDRHRTKQLAGPFCLPCFRRRTDPSSRRLWLSASSPKVRATVCRALSVEQPPALASRTAAAPRGVSA
jgi:hypothetical protein